ncbi:ankyrin repeat-containing domain protein [Staphylotrichum tortipilum]|uniref:Ankyrin repeat-containing domain protein n=1 Tax=Staphylotrichum tortipilum TaxID=2831512 RepID=A0AAN6MEV3_9PEZI|nr:ankyrin repeat-containing domain protein [Staphylotrichum longicolle]
MQWTVPDTALSIAFALKGDIDGLKYLFSKGLASPSDWALYGGMHQYETVEFLISQGAPVDDESYEHAFDFAFRKRCNDTELEALRCIRYSRGNDWIEEQNFSLLHHIIFGISTCSLASALKENPNAAHVTDAQGRTALDWATARGQLKDMELLMKHNSNINSMDARGRTTILHAVDSHNNEAVRMLLNAGANPNPRVPEGLFRSSPLKAASFGGLAEMVNLLLRFGAEIDAHNPEGQTALHAAVIAHNVECARVLLESGATLEDAEHNGRTPLTLAIVHNSHEVLRLFVDRRYEHVTAAHIKGPQVLAVVAEFADAETMKIIASSLLLRLDYDEKLDHAFEQLLYSIAMAKEESVASRTADGDIQWLHHLFAESSFSEELEEQPQYPGL